jgi:ribulose-5-phosphate 4-epimerase/fuculose-1-phosphate aldolase
MSNDARELVAASSRVLAAAGHDDLVWGHSSMRDPGGRGVWIKSAEWGLDEVTPERVQLVGHDGTLLEGGGVPHSELPIHTEIMAARPDVGGVVHTHPPHAVALAAAGLPLRPVSHAANYFVPPDVPAFTETADLVLTPALGRSLAAVLGGARAVFLVNHGIVTVGESLQQATVAAVLLERACAQQLLTATAATARPPGTEPSWSSPEESLSKREHIYHDRAVAAVWDHLVRRLPGAGLAGDDPPGNGMPSTGMPSTGTGTGTGTR